MNSRSNLARIRGTEHVLSARNHLLLEGQSTLQSVIMAANVADTHFQASATERTLHRDEAYGWFVAIRRAACAWQNMPVGHMRFQYALPDKIDDAASALDSKRTCAEQIEALPGLWNFIPRKVAISNRQDAHRQLAGCFRTDVYGMPPSGELESVFEENVPEPFAGMLAALERERFVDDWQKFAHEQGV